MREPLFLIALLPDESLRKEVTAFKHDCARLFQASHALASPPHITLRPPFPWSPANLQRLGDALGDFAAGQPPFEVVLQNFNCFKPRVIFVAIVPNPQLAHLQASLEKHLEKKAGLKNEHAHGFNPHMTIAHRDLEPRMFQKAWEHFSKIEYGRRFQAEGVTLLRHERGRWEMEEEYFFR